MVDSNHGEPGASTSMEQRAMASGPPPQMVPGGHPRYSQQHTEHERPGGHPMGYGGPHSSHGSFRNSYTSYPPPPYGNSMDGNYGGGPPPGYPRGAYSMPPHSFPFGAGYGAGPGGGPGGYSQPTHHPGYSYAGGYESHYGGQPPPSHLPHPHGPPTSYRGPSPVPPPSTSGSGSSAFRVQNSHPLGTSPPSELNSLVSGGPSMPTKKVNSPTGGAAIAHSSAIAAISEGNGKRSSPQQLPQARQPDHGEVERLRAAAATEITNEEVKPIQTDFHFFVKEHLGKYRKIAEEEVRSSMKDKPETLDPMLVNSNLNTQLMKAWENLTKEKRGAYMIHEETDRRRFMEEDEIASRHCATLTARGKSPRVAGTDTIKELAALQRHKEHQQVKVKKELQQEQGDGEGGNEEKKAEESAKEEAKRSVPGNSPGNPSADIHGSPSKKNKVGE